VIGNIPTQPQVFTQQALEYRRTLFQSTQRRLASLDKRMSNIIQLSFHLVTQGDSRMMQSENQSMKTIAIMTLIFMPLGTVASIFGTQFMQLQEEAPHHITVSQDFWLMWIIAAPLTILVIVIWRVWYRDAKGRLVDDIPPRSKDEHGYMGWKELRQTMLKKQHHMRLDKGAA
jgi:Mg2+ and Co2+ transporter CorA